MKQKKLTKKKILALLAKSFVLGSLLLGGSAYAQTAVTEYTTVSDGEWVGFGSQTPAGIDAKYSGTRWDGGVGWDMSWDPAPARPGLAYPGGASSGSTLETMTGVTNDVAIINHSITLSSPAPGYGEFGQIGRLYINDTGSLTVSSNTLFVSDIVDYGWGPTDAGQVRNGGVLNISGSANITAASVTNYGTLTVDGSAALKADWLENRIGGTVVINNSNNGISLSDFSNYGGSITLNNSSITTEYFENSSDYDYNTGELIPGTFELRNSKLEIVNEPSVTYSGGGYFGLGGDFKLADGSSLIVRDGVYSDVDYDARLLIEGAGNAVKMASIREIVGTDATRDFVDVDLSDAPDRVYFSNVTANLSASTYETNGDGVSFNNAFVTGSGSSDAFIDFYGVSGIKGNGSTFNADYLVFTGGNTVIDNANVVGASIANFDPYETGIASLVVTNSTLDTSIARSPWESSSLLISFANYGANGTITLQDSTVNAPLVSNHQGTLELYNSGINVTEGTYNSNWNPDDPDNGRTFSQFENSGKLTLANGSSLTGGANATYLFTADSSIAVSGANNAIQIGKMQGVGTNLFAVSGTNAATDFIAIDSALSFDGGKGNLYFENIEAKLASNVYANVNTATFTNAFASGNGHSAVDFVFNGGGVLGAGGMKPGNSPGTFYGNSFTFNGATLYIEVGSSAYDQIVATGGNIEFAGVNNVVLINFDNTDVLHTLTVQEIFQAPAGEVLVATDDLAATDVNNIAGNKIEIAADASNKVIINSAVDGNGNDQFVFGEATMDADGNIAFDAIGQESEPTDPVTPTNNFERLAGVYNRMVLNGGNALTDAVAAYVGLSQDRLIEAMNELDPTALSLSNVFVQNAVETFTRTNYDRLRYLQDGGYGSKAGCDPCAASCGKKYRNDIWFQGLANWTDQSRTEIDGYTADTYGFALGLDRRVSNRTVIGAAFGGSFTKARMDERAGFLDADSYLFSVYGSHKVNRFRLSGNVGYGFNDLSSKRYANTIGGFAEGNRDANTFFAGFEVAYRFGNRNGYLTPFLAYDYVNFAEDAYRESGALINMNVDKRYNDGHLQTLGARFGREFKTRRGWIINPELTAGWLHDYGDGCVRTAGTFVVDPTVPFIVDGVSRNKDRALIGVKADVSMSPRTNLFVRYDGEFADGYNTQYVSAGLGFAF